MYEFLFERLQFPVAPEKLQTKITNQNKTMNLINGKEINLPKLPGLSEISFDLMLPAVRYPFADYPDGFHTPDYYLGALEMLKTEKRPFRFIVNRRLPGGQYSFDTNLSMLLEDYTIEEEAKSGFDVTVSIKLKQYVPYGTASYKVEEKADGTTEVTKETPRETQKQPVKTYTVKSGDTLWAICKRELGDGGKYGEVAKKNGIPDPNKIYPGQVIRFA